MSRRLTGDEGRASPTLACHGRAPGDAAAAAFSDVACDYRRAARFSPRSPESVAPLWLSSVPESVIWA
jgi:hypothetical protein